MICAREIDLCQIIVFRIEQLSSCLRTILTSSGVAYNTTGLLESLVSPCELIVKIFYQEWLIIEDICMSLDDYIIMSLVIF